MGDWGFGIREKPTIPSFRRKPESILLLCGGIKMDSGLRLNDEHEELFRLSNPESPVPALTAAS